MKLFRSKLSIGLIILVLVAGFFGMQKKAKAADPIEIDSCQDLQNINNNLSADYIITQDFSCAQATRTEGGSLYSNGAGFEPIGYNEEEGFTGTLDGQGYTIDGLYINRPDSDLVAPFARARGGQITNLNLTNETIVASIMAAGLVADNTSTISNVNVNVDITSNSIDNGGLVGTLNGDITNSRATGSITATLGSTGGLVGWQEGGTISGSSANVTVLSTGWNKIGGLVGYAGGAINTSHATGNVTGSGSANVGGFVGELSNGGTITTSYATGDVSGNSGVGGFVGAISESGTISHSFATGDVATAHGTAGGFAGYTNVWGDDNISYCHATGDVTGTSQNYLGGFLGWGNGGILTNDYATGNVSGWSSIGGLVGNNGNTINHSYATGNVSGNSGVGGFIGTDWVGVTNTYSYGATSTTGSEPSAIGGFIGNPAEGWDYADTGNWWYGSGTALGLDIATDPNIAESLADLRTNGATDFNFDTVWTATADDPTLQDMPDLVANDSSLPIFENLPGDDAAINVDEGQTITTNPYTIEVYPTSLNNISHVDFYIDDIFVCTDIEAEDGTYTCEWDTETYQSDLKIYAYDDYYNRSTALERTTTVDLVEEAETSRSNKPTFTNLPGLHDLINIINGQTITTNPFTIEVHPTSSGGIAKVEFYIDDILICTDTELDINGVYACDWDTSQYHSIVKVIAYDKKGRIVTIERNTTVSLLSQVTELPQVGANNIFTSFKRFILAL